MVILDTNIIIDHLRQSKTKDSLLVKIARQKPKEILALSIISVQELYEGKSTNELADAAIGATVIANGAQLLTLNEKDFRGIKDLELTSFN